MRNQVMYQQSQNHMLKSDENFEIMKVDDQMGVS